LAADATQAVTVQKSTVAVPEPTVAVQDLEIEVDARSPFDADFTKIDNAQDPDPSFTTTLCRESGGRFRLDGYCPVSLLTESRWVRGATEYQHEYHRVIYSLNTAAHLKMFMANPDKYIPYLHGCDPVALENDNRIQLGASSRKLAYFLASENNRAAFLKTPERFSADQSVAVAN
jgi:YHS domain-containing protein